MLENIRIILSKTLLNRGDNI